MEFILIIHLPDYDHIWISVFFWILLDVFNLCRWFWWLFFSRWF